MKYFLFTIVFSIKVECCFGQYKIVELKVDSAKIYLRYYYKSKKASNEIVNDSVSFFWRKITADTFYLDKYLYKRKFWTKKYTIEFAKDSLFNISKNRDIRGVVTVIRSRPPYYNSSLITA